ncbi:centrosomal protein of 89 kDa-like isoform X1 [Osmerus eperlanus]|uniref:centrosomal protein of 89 kDa-like isoform X1 n=1 Tax=Osmerus eperlanus TaxID=29151 RepID=UPI002E10CB77
MMSKFSFRRSEKNEFKHIAHGLIPAATIAPRPAVPRTPPPRSPCPSPDRDRSALAAAILSSSLTGRTVAIPPTRSFSRSLSESDCSHLENNNIFQPPASTALYTEDRWRESLADRPRLPSPGCSDEDYDEDEEEEVLGREGLSEEDHVYQSLDRQGRSRSRTTDDVYAKPLKQGFQSEGAEETDDSLGIVSPLPREEIEVQKGAFRTPSPKPERRPSSNRAMPTPDFTDDTSARSPKENQGSSTKKSQKKSTDSRTGGSSGPREAYREVLDVQREMTRALTEQNQGLAAERRALEQRCTEQSLQLQRSHERLQQLELSRASAQTGPTTGEQAELLSLRQQAQELVDENDSLKMTVHRLNVELSRYQARFRPLGKEESSRVGGLPTKGSAPPWLLDMKYLSPLMLAYEDRLSEKDVLLQSVEEDLGKFRQRVEEVVRENERLHEELTKTGGISHKEWRQLQEQARLVLQENQVLIEQLEVQHAKAKDSHSRHHTEVTKVSKQLMLLEAEKQRLEAELGEVRAELRMLQAQHQQARSCLENAVSWEEHCAIATKLKRQLEQEGGRQRSEVEELQARVSTLQAEKRSLVLDKAGLAADIKRMEAEWELSRHASRKAQRKIGVLKQQMEASLEKELTAHQYLASIVTLAEKTTLERDQLMHMASALEQDKQGVLATALDGTVRLGKLHERVKEPGVSRDIQPAPPLIALSEADETPTRAHADKPRAQLHETPCLEAGQTEAGPVSEAPPGSQSLSPSRPCGFISEHHTSSIRSSNRLLWASLR